MQTFLPFPDYGTSAAVLDQKRLGKQRVENLQIMTALMTGKGWTNHPATLMWRRYEWALLQYQFAICHEWTDRGHKDTCYEKTKDIYDKNRKWLEELILPYWTGNARFHLSHQSNLMRKDREHYSQFFPGVRDDLEYYWPEPASGYTKLSEATWWEDGVRPAV